MMKSNDDTISLVMESVARFVAVSEEEVINLQNDAIPQSTKNKERWAINISNKRT